MAEVVRDDQLTAGAGTAREVALIPAASVILLRDDPLEVLMIRRHETSTFVPNAWVFPGGALEEQDAAPDLSGAPPPSAALAGERAGAPQNLLNRMKMAAARELFEETGISLGTPVDLESLVWTSRWITPVGVPKRFDTYFFLACAGRDTVTILQRSEAVDSIWISPADAVQRHTAGDFTLVFPTLKNLEAIVGFRKSAELMQSRRNAEIPTTRPILLIEDGQKKIVLP